MNTLHIHLNGDGSLTAVEREFDDEAKYVETFKTWEDLLRSLLPWMDTYAWTCVHTN